jgi:hypothetical protein
MAGWFLAGAGGSRGREERVGARGALLKKAA